MNKVIKKMTVCLILAGIICFVALLSNQTMRYRMIGKLSGESFFRDLPTSYWIDMSENNFNQTTATLKEGGVEAIPVINNMLMRGEDAIPVACAALYEMGSEAKEAVPALVRA